jgi:cell division transport system permease protein
MMRLRLFFAEALRSIKSNAAISTSAIVTVLITGFILGSALATYLYVQSQVDTQRGRVEIKAYIQDGATPEQVNAFQRRVVSTAHVQKALYVSKDEALKREQKRLKNSDILDVLPGNPYPASFEITPDNPDNNAGIMKALEGDPALLRDKLSPTGLSDGGPITKKLLKVSRFISWTGLALVLTLLVSSILLIANTIRLSIFARRREVEVMKLVGATNWFIRWPFIIEGVICGLIGGLLSAMLLFIAKRVIVDNLLLSGGDSLLKGGDASIGFVPLALLVVLTGAAVGALGSGVTLRRFLKV